MRTLFLLRGAPGSGKVREKSSEDVQVELYMEDDGLYSKIADFNVCWLPDLIKCLSEAKKFLK